MVYTIFEVLVLGFFTLKSLETVKAEVVFVLVLAVDGDVVLLLILNY